MKSLENLNYNFWKFFKKISAIPRQSGNEEKIADYLVEFSKNRNLKYYRDDINNVIIWKNSTRENSYCETIGLQCHTDMVCEKKSNSKHNFLTNFRNGALIKDNFGNVILSANLAAINSTPNAVNLLYSTRYNSEILGANLKKEILNLMQQYNITTKNYSHILGYEQSENSKLINTCQNLYFKFFNEEIKIIKVQACLECGYFADKIPNLQFIAIAPNIYNAHSPSEKLSIKSADKMWNFICKLIENIK